LHFPQQEIIPQVKGTLRWNKLSNSSDPELAKGVSKFSSPQTEIRALIEGQMLHHKSIASEMGYSFGENTRILTTGGGSENKSILQVISDVFGAPVYVQKSSEAAVLGAAFRAKYVHYTSEKTGEEKESYFEYTSKFLPHHMQRICDPSPDSSDIYSVMQQRYLEMINVLE
ncbi:Xylulose kinase, partial [Pseudolycoriella hygida]